MQTLLPQPVAPRMSHAPRICHIGFNYFPGQGLTIFHEFARHQAKLGIDVSAIAPGRPGEPVEERVEGVLVRRIQCPSIGRFSASRAIFLLEASRWLRSQSFDLIHVYAFAGAGFLPWLAGKNSAIWLYDCQTSAIKAPLIAVQNLLIRIESWPYDAITVLSDGIREIVFGDSAHVAAIIPLGADFDRFAPSPEATELRIRYGIPKTAAVLTYCGTLDHNRQLERMISAFAHVAAIDNRAVLLVIGDGSALDELKQLAHTLKLVGRIIFTGFVPYSDIPAHLSITTIALAFIAITPYFQHQPPTKTVEYLANGLPVVATNTAGNREFIKNNYNGLLRSDAPDDFGNAVLQLLHNVELRTTIAERARPSVIDYDWRTIVSGKVLPVYEKLLSHNPR